MDDQRLDKWLWCARFFKTRSVAQDAINAGRVTVNGLRAKPAKTLGVGDEITIKIPPFEYIVHVAGLASQRVSAPLARALYAETPASLLSRETLRETLRLGAVIEDRGSGKLSKRDRRARETLKRGWEDQP
jgi:ribosome-associated heat shock protein Hsp15